MAFEQNIISKRFLKACERLEIDGKFKTRKELAEKLGIHQQSMSQISKGMRDITIAGLSNLFSHYQVDPNFIFKEENYPNTPEYVYLPKQAGLAGSATAPVSKPTEEPEQGVPLFQQEEQVLPSRQNKNAAPNLTVNEPNVAYDASVVAKQPQTPYRMPEVRPLAITVDSAGNENIVMVQSRAAAGYTGQLAEPEFIQNLPVFSLPGNQFRNATFRCFEVAGASMESTIYGGDWVIASYLDNWLDALRDGYIYVVVTHESILVKRVLNRVHSFNQLVLKSDNPAGYNNIYLDPEEVQEIWQVKARLSFNFPNENLNLLRKIEDLEINVDQIKNSLSGRSSF